MKSRFREIEEGLSKAASAAEEVIESIPEEQNTRMYLAEDLAVLIDEAREVTQKLETYRI